MMDAVTYESFLDQFNVETDHLPKLIILDSNVYFLLIFSLLFIIYIYNMYRIISSMKIQKLMN